MRHRRPIRMTAKRPGECLNCSIGIEPGESIEWAPKSGAWHRNCAEAKHARAEKADRERADRKCHRCERTDARMYTPGPYTVIACPTCWEAWLDANDFYRQLAKREAAQAETADAHDLRYEDDCARQCGL